MFRRTVPVCAILTITLSWLVGCSSAPSQDRTVGRSEEPPAPAVASAVKSDEPEAAVSGTPIGSLQGRKHTLTFYSTPEGPRFSVSTLDGDVLGEQMSVDQLRAQLPDVYETFKSSIAGTGGNMDASLRLGASR